MGESGFVLFTDVVKYLLVWASGFPFCSSPSLANIAAPCAPLVPALVGLAWSLQRGSAASERSFLLCPSSGAQLGDAGPMLGLAGFAHMDQHLIAMGFPPAWEGTAHRWQSKLRLHGHGDRDAVSCHVHSALCFVFKGHYDGMDPAAFRTRPWGFARSVGFHLLCPCFSSSKFPSVPIHLSHLTAFGQQQFVQFSRWLPAFLPCVRAGLESVVIKALDGTSAFSVLGLPTLPLVDLNHSVFGGLMSPSQFPIGEDVIAADPVKCGRTDFSNWSHTQVFIKWSSWRRPLRAALISQDSSLANREDLTWHFWCFQSLKRS